MGPKSSKCRRRIRPPGSTLSNTCSPLGACQVEISSQGLANLAAGGLSLRVVRSLLGSVPARPPDHGGGAPQEEGSAAPGTGGAGGGHGAPVRAGGDRGAWDPSRRTSPRWCSATHARDDHKLVPRGITMMGPPGVGKTALAEALARDAGFNFVKLLESLAPSG